MPPQQSQLKEKVKNKCKLTILGKKTRGIGHMAHQQALYLAEHVHVSSHQVSTLPRLF